MRSMSKEHLEDTSENKEEESKPQGKRGRKPNKTLRCLKATQEKVTENQTSLDHPVRIISTGKKVQGATKENKDKTRSQNQNK